MSLLVIGAIIGAISDLDHYRLPDAKGLVSMQRWMLGMTDEIRLEINSLGSAEARHAYRQTLVGYLQQHRELLDEDSLRRLDTNPLRILDTKNASMQELVAGAPTLMAHLGEESRAHFETLRAGLDACGVSCRLNPRLVRGLDYYARTVFEWVTDKLGSQGAVCSGGRYDGLVSQLGGKSTPAIATARLWITESNVYIRR